ncbi:MAG: four helix bundle protein [Candidatus Pacebacteria bacterium]|jgi:four helix bundle protein|nr:four helix bundle protein [Candidatus Paceibacterota bacterium]
MKSFKNYRFEDLAVWKIGMQIVGEVYRLTQSFPKTELFALTDQLKRASTSIVLNIAEGSAQSSKKHFALYANRTKASTLECIVCIKIAIQQQFLKISDCDTIEALL